MSNKKSTKKNRTAQKKMNSVNKMMGKKQDSMKEKIEVKIPSNSDKASRIVGTIFIGLGVLLVAFGIYSFIQFRADPVYDESFDIPVLEYVTELTNTNEVMAKGNAEGYDSVAIFINDEKTDEVKVKDGVFEYSYTAQEDGQYSVSVAGLKGFPIRKVSGRSASLIAIVDRTAPSEDKVKLVYGQETNKSSFKLTGELEANATIEIKRGVQVYDTIADKDGYFEISDIALDEGKNVFNVVVSDRAGNSVTLDQKVRIEYALSGDINGDAVADEYTQDMGKDIAGADDNLPQAAGDLDNLIIRNLMIIFGLAALFVFSGSSVYAFSKKR